MILGIPEILPPLLRGTVAVGGFRSSPRYVAMATAVVHSRPWIQRAAPAAALGSLLFPAGVFAWLMTHPASDPSIVVPRQHFIIVTAVSVVAFGLAALLAIASVQIAQYRVLFLCLGFMALGGIFAVHGIETPGILMSGEYVAAVKGVSAYLSLFIPALFFAASYTPITAAFERRLPYSPAGWLIVLVGAAVPFGVKPYSTAMAGTTIALLLFAAARQARGFAAARLPLQGTLVIAFVLLAEAQVIMLVGTAWRLSWWEYHALMLIAVSIAVGSLAAQRAKGQSLRSVMEATLDLEVKVGFELEHADTIVALAAAVEARDENTKGHNHRVAELAGQIGRTMGLPPA